MKNNAHITKYSATLIKGNIILSYKFFANIIQLGSLSDAHQNSMLIIPLDQTNHSAKNLADIIIMIHNTPNTTYLIHSFIFSSAFDVIILYQPINAIAIQTTIKISIAYHINDLT
jgi:hypothetical protein